MAKLSLQDRLARSLDSANKREKPTPTPKPIKCRPTPCRRRSDTAARQCSKLSISLFSEDLARLEAIRSYMAARGARISTSQSIKLALRTARLSEDLTAALAEIRKEDGRTK